MQRVAWDRRQMQRDALIAVALLTAAAAPLVVFVFGDAGSGAASVVLGVYAVLALVALLGLGLAWRRERRARHRTNRETWALLPANLTLRDPRRPCCRRPVTTPRPGWTTAAPGGKRLSARRAGPPATVASPPSSCWTWTASRPSTTAWAMKSATTSWSGSPTLPPLPAWERCTRPPRRGRMRRSPAGHQARGGYPGRGEAATQSRDRRG